MPELDFIDHSPQHPDPSDPIPTASNLVLIDNYDSFTWNVYQYLVLEGATVTVFRNDQISLDELVAKKPTQLVISPGPGHPLTDAGISDTAIKYFSGKIPILGVCMGEQCIFSAFGGRVEQTGEILHGKTSPLRHDGKGVYSGLPQDLPVTRYHSLAGTHGTLPECLEISSWTAAGPSSEKGIIMGVRHKTFLVEGVQFHPESILTAEGRVMLKNFLHMQGGTWAENEALSKSAQRSVNGIVPVKEGAVANGFDSKSSILDRIYDHRRATVDAQKRIPSQRFEDLQAAYDLDLAPPLVSFPDRLRQTPFNLSLMAEIKRASPSKGIISMSVCAPVQARVYATAGASTISVLTEPEWFKGSLEDMRTVRQALEGMPNRPAVLRKDFIFDEYQILEARLAGADTVLLIVKMLDVETLTRLYEYSQGLGMEPLVEVNNIDEMEVAVKLGAKVIGVNNRNLVSFEVDMGTTTRLVNMTKEGTILCALSGISGPQDVKPYQEANVGAVLVGEALMRAKNTAGFIATLLGGDQAPANSSTPKRPLVKICGTRSAAAAQISVESGADLIGMILVQGRKRCVSTETALEISKVVHQTPKILYQIPTSVENASRAESFFEHTGKHHLQHPKRALLVGVFRDQPLEYILEQQRILHLDIVQLHGSEPLEWAKLIPCPVIRAFHLGDAGLGATGYHVAPLLDSGIGGTGTRLASDKVITALESDPGVRVMLAGGLDATNIVAALTSLGPAASQVVGVDVSSGIETDGEQDLDKIRAFIKCAKSVTLP